MYTSNNKPNSRLFHRLENKNNNNPKSGDNCSHAHPAGTKIIFRTFLYINMHTAILLLTKETPAAPPHTVLFV